MKNIGRFIPLIFWTVIGISIFLILQFFYKYQFYYTEQTQLFLYNKMYLSKLFFSIGGLSEIVAQWLIQFYVHPMVGAGITTLLALCIALLMIGIIKRIANDATTIIFPLLTAASLVFLHFDILYYAGGTIAFILCLISLLCYIRIPNIIKRITTATILSVLLFWWGGSVSILFVVCVLIWEILVNIKKSYLALIPIALSIALSIVSVHLGWVGEYRFAFLPDLYYYNKVAPQMNLYYSWILLPLMIVITFIVAKKKVKQKTFYIATSLEVIISFCIITWFLLPRYGDFNSQEYKELDYYARTNNWDKIIEKNKGTINNLLHLYLLNLALLEKGELAEKMLSFDQRGPMGLDLSQTQSDFIGLLLQCDYHFSIGNIAAAQQTAFESNVTISISGSPRFYQRLVQTNLIFGSYAVAEKYIEYLEQTHAYKKWAQYHRQFLYNDQAVENDPILGKKRQGITNNYLYLNFDYLKGLEELAKADKTNKSAIEYFGMFCLLHKDVDLFMKLMELCYGEEGKCPILPTVFQEAIVIATEGDLETWAKYEIEEVTALRYQKYKEIYFKQAKKDMNASANLLKGEYGNSYWYYFMFK